MKHLTPAIIVLFLSLTLSAQSPVWKYTKTGSSGQVSEMQSDSSGNIYLVGTFNTDKFTYQGKSVKGINRNEYFNLFLLKTAHTGTGIWFHSIYADDSLGEIDYLKSVVTSSGEFVVAFAINSTAGFHIGGYSFPNDTSANNFYVAKFSKTGFLTWVKKASAKSGFTSPFIKLTDMVADTSGAIVVTGYFNGTTATIGTKSINGTENDAMMFLSLISSDGNVPWITGVNSDTTGSGSIKPTSVVVSKDNLIYLSGYYMGTRNYYFATDLLKLNNSNNAFLSCFTHDGLALWGRAFSGDQDDFPGSLVAGKDGSVFFDGYFNSTSLPIGAGTVSASSFGYDLFLTHYDATGNLIKSVIYPLQKSFIDYTYQNGYLSVDPSGNVVFCSTFERFSLFNTADSLINADPGTNDICFAKFNQTTLSPMWTAQVAGIGDNYYDGIFLDPNGNVLLTGTFFSDVTVNSSPITADSKDGTPYLAFVKDDGTADYLFSKNNSTSNHIMMQKVVSDRYGNSYVAGGFSGTGNVLGTDTLVSSDTDGLFIARYSRIKTLSGSVKNENGDIISKGYVKLFGYTWAQRSPISDSADIDASGNFTFAGVPLGKYIIKAFPSPEIANDYIPTYYPSADNWRDAQTIMVNLQSSPGNLDITMLPKTLAGGNSTLDGQVFEQDSTDFYKSTENVGKPARRDVVILAEKGKSTTQAYYTTLTDDNGNFAFSDVQNGIYNLWVEIPGLPVTTMYTVEVTNNQLVSSLNYLVGEDEITPLSSPVYNSIDVNTASSGISVGPNPAHDMLIVNIENIQSGKLVFYNLEGALIRSQNVREGFNSISVTDIPKGTYLVRIISNERTVVKKISILH